MGITDFFTMIMSLEIVKYSQVFWEEEEEMAKPLQIYFSRSSEGQGDVIEKWNLAYRLKTYW